MVYYFVSNVTSPPATIYVGKDKFESSPPPPPPGFTNPCQLAHQAADMVRGVVQMKN